MSFHVMIGMCRPSQGLWTHLRTCAKRRQFHTSPCWDMRFHNRRYRGGNNFTPSKVLLDKFVKHLAPDGALVVRAPFSIQLKGSYFDDRLNVNREKNSRMVRQYQDQHTSTEPIASGSESLQQSATSEKGQELKRLTTLMSEHVSNVIASSSSPKNVSSQDEKQEDFVHLEPTATSPLHILLYGQEGHRLDSYSVVNSSNQHHTYAYLSDASSLDDDTMKEYHFSSAFDEAVVSSPTGFTSTAHFSLWKPTDHVGGSKDEEQLTEEDKDKTFVSALKLFSFKHIVESVDSSLKALCLVPTAMNKLYIQADNGAHIHLDGTLIDDLRKVGLSTEAGNIRIKDVTADEISLSSQVGDISFDGIIDGNIMVETFCDGDVSFKGSTVYGGSLVVSTDDGDINLWTEVQVDECFLSTRNGNITAKEQLATHTTIFVSETGLVTANVFGGSIEASINHGDAYIFVADLLDDSEITVSKGDVQVTVPTANCNFKLSVTAPMANIAPKLQNSGHLSLCQETGMELFSTEDSKVESLPTLTIKVSQGTVNLAVAEKETNKAVDYQYDSVA